MFGLWFSLKVHGLQIGAPYYKRSSICSTRHIISEGRTCTKFLTADSVLMKDLGEGGSFLLNAFWHMIIFFSLSETVVAAGFPAPGGGGDGGEGREGQGAEVTGPRPDALAFSFYVAAKDLRNNKRGGRLRLHLCQVDAIFMNSVVSNVRKNSPKASTKEEKTSTVTNRTTKKNGRTPSWRGINSQIPWVVTAVCLMAGTV